MGSTQEKIQGLHEIINENTALKERNERLDSELRELQQSTKEMKADLKKLEKFRGLVDNSPPVWTFEIRNKTLIASIMASVISIKGRYANYPNARTDELKEKAKNIIDSIIIEALEDTFMSRPRFNEMVSRRRLLGEEEDGN